MVLEKEQQTLEREQHALEAALRDSERSRALGLMERVAQRFVGRQLGVALQRWKRLVLAARSGVCNLHCRVGIGARSIV